MSQVPMMDKYGFTKDDDEFTIDIDDDYTDILPDDQLPKARAMQYAQAWFMSWVDILNMMYADFYEATIVHKAVTYRRPWWPSSVGREVYIHERATNKPFKKPRRNQ